MPTFPDDFLWGTATAAYQIEGAVGADGRGESIWDRFCRLPGRIADGSTGSVACDHYHRWREDVALLRDLGVGAYRFSIAWPRLFPAGRGPLNRRGLDFYERLVDALGEVGIQPWATLYHWDLPQELQFRGGWRNRDTAHRFVDYACATADRLGDRIVHWLPMNEVAVVAWMGHATGRHAPGIADRTTFFAALHHLNLAQGLAIEAMRRENGRWRLGSALNLMPVAPADDSQGGEDAAFLLDALWNGAVVEPMLEGRYPEIIEGDLKSFVEERDLERIRQKVDFVGLNHYSRVYARQEPASTLGVGMAPPPPGRPVTAMGWEIDGAAFREILLRLKDRHGNPPVYVTETGAAFDDRIDADGRVEDRDRIAFLEEYLSALADARDAGCDVRGCFLWSLLDNFEWAEGYTKRFGLAHVDFATQARTPKSSFDWYAALTRENRF
ncbi:MAG TPA: GH1 family beta-glucosidase [Alphaproteobacteria bacterium]|nr:GH1 family beta-glucosidase [Alphaproteobacteria bacterium]